MRSFEERKAEVVSRSSKAIERRKAARRLIRTASGVIALCLCVAFGLRLAQDGENLFKGDFFLFGNEENASEKTDAPDENYSPGDVGESKPMENDGIGEEDNVPEYTEPDASVDGEMSGGSIMSTLKMSYAKYLSESDDRHKEITGNDIYIERLNALGNGAYAAIFSCDCCGYDLALWSETVGGIEIQYNDGRAFTVWYQNEFYSLQEAYDILILTVEDIKQIAETN